MLSDCLWFLFWWFAWTFAFGLQFQLFAVDVYCAYWFDLHGFLCLGFGFNLVCLCFISFLWFICFPDWFGVLLWLVVDVLVLGLALPLIVPFISFSLVLVARLALFVVVLCLSGVYFLASLGVLWLDVCFWLFVD